MDDQGTLNHFWELKQSPPRVPEEISTLNQQNRHQQQQSSQEVLILSEDDDDDVPVRTLKPSLESNNNHQGETNMSTNEYRSSSAPSTSPRRFQVPPPPSSIPSQAKEENLDKQPKISLIPQYQPRKKARLSSSLIPIEPPQLQPQIETIASSPSPSPSPPQQHQSEPVVINLLEDSSDNTGPSQPQSQSQSQSQRQTQLQNEIEQDHQDEIYDRNEKDELEDDEEEEEEVEKDELEDKDDDEKDELEGNDEVEIATPAVYDTEDGKDDTTEHYYEDKNNNVDDDDDDYDDSQHPHSFSYYTDHDYSKQSELLSYGDRDDDEEDYSQYTHTGEDPETMPEVEEESQVVENNDTFSRDEIIMCDDDDEEEQDEDEILEEIEDEETEYNSISQTNAFSALMAGNKRSNEWIAAEQSEKKKSQSRSRKLPTRNCPFYKIMSPLPFAVDAFRYGKVKDVSAYFLTHAHGDHYTNLSGSWNAGPIFCSETTANLIKMKLGVKEEWVKPLEMNIAHKIQGVDVTLIDANHCPGSVLFVFESNRGSRKKLRILHCGDFRASPAQLRHPALNNKKFDVCYLDTTYLNPRYTFPAQEQVVETCAQMIHARLNGDTKVFDKSNLIPQNNKKPQQDGATQTLKNWLISTAKSSLSKFTATAHDDTDKKNGILDESSIALKTDNDEKSRFLVLIGTYSIGKERIVKGIAKALNSKIYCSESKRKIFDCIKDDDEFISMLTTKPLEAQVHVTNLFQIRGDTLEEYLLNFKGHFDNIIGLRPTGWSFRPGGESSSEPLTVSKIINDLTNSPPKSQIVYPQRDSTETCQAFSVCYSEHSSFAELTCFCVSLDVSKIIATVNVGSSTSRAKMNGWFEKWAKERKRRKDAHEDLFVTPRSESYW